MAESAAAGSPGALTQLERTSVAAFVCPSDAAAVEGCASYCGNAGTGFQRSGLDGMNGYAGPVLSPPGGVIRPRDVTDGLSNTAAFSEALVSDGTFARRRSTWILEPRSAPHELDALAAECAAVPTAPSDAGIEGGPFPLGRSWTNFNIGMTLYNHVLPPNAPRCFNGGNHQLGIFPAGSMHPGGCHVVFADGHLKFMSETVAVSVWRAIGSRAGSE